MKPRRVTLTFVMDEDQFRAILNGDAPRGKNMGITVESIASKLLKEHDPAQGYINWMLD